MQRVVYDGPGRNDHRCSDFSGRPLDTSALGPIRAEHVGFLEEVSETPEQMMRRIVREEIAAVQAEQTGKRPFRPTVALCIRLAADEFGISVKQILGSSKLGPIVRARQAAMWLADQVTGQNATDVGRRMGRDHTTVLHGCRKVESLRNTNADFDASITALIMLFRADI